MVLVESRIESKQFYMLHYFTRIKLAMMSPIISHTTDDIICHVTHIDKHVVVGSLYIRRGVTDVTIRASNEQCYRNHCPLII